MAFRDPDISSSRIRQRRSFVAGESPAAGELRPGEVAVNAAGGSLFVGLLDGSAASHYPVVFKSKAEAQSVSGESLVNDTDLFFFAASNSTYRIEVAMAHLDENTGFCQLAVAVPAGASIYGSVVLPTGAFDLPWSDGSTSYVANELAKFVDHHHVVKTAATAGNVNFQFAQQSDGVFVTRSAGSWMLAAKVA